MAACGSAVKRFCSSKPLIIVRHYSAPADRAIPAAKQRYVPSSGYYPQGFRVGTAHAGVKPSNTKYDDVALFASDRPCAAAATFTRNAFAAAPVAFSKALLSARSGAGIRGVVINSGCANAVTGTTGANNAALMAGTTDRCLDPTLPAPSPGHWDGSDTGTPRTLVMSTGVIGQQLPIDRIEKAIPKAHAALGATHEHWMAAAKAICTTDTFPKLVSRSFTLPSHPDTEYRIAGMTKGAGMIHPNMGTLLGVICTDANIAPESMLHLLRRATNASFNCISIDGDTSTNDTVALLANGAAAPPDIPPLAFEPASDPANNHERANSDSEAFRVVLKDLMVDLAKLVVRDGEGATKFVTIRVQCQDMAKARAAATSIATSALVKTALYGKDANWGRILCAIGYAPGVSEDGRPAKGGDFKVVTDLRQTSVSFIAPADSGLQDLPVLVDGEPQLVDEAKAKELLEQEDIEILVRLGQRAESVHLRQKLAEWPMREYTFWTCDFSHEYVTINGDYRT